MLINRAASTVLVVGLVAAAVSYQPVYSGLNDMVSVMSSMDIDRARQYILSFGLWAPAISFLMMLLQAVAAPLPAFIITFANAAIFGWWQGAILSWASAMAAAALCFLISRNFRRLPEKMVSHLDLQKSDSFFRQHGKYAILISRLLPFISFDIVSYAAGLTSMKIRHFLLATGIGQLPATLIYSYVGGMLTGTAKLFVTGLLTFFAISVAIYFWKIIYRPAQATA